MDDNPVRRTRQAILSNAFTSLKNSADWAETCLR